MKALLYRILGCTITVFQAIFVMAQEGSVPDMNDELHQLYSGLQKPFNQSYPCYSNFLYDMSVEVTNDYQTNLGVTSVKPSFDWYSHHFEFYNRSYIKGFLPTTRSIKNIADDIFDSERKVPLAIMDFSYYEFRDDAFDVQGQYFDWDDYKVWDVTGRTIEPYKVSNLQDYNLTFFKCSTLKDSYKHRKVKYKFDPRLIFYDQQYSCHYRPYHQLQVNFNGSWITIDPKVVTDIEIIYPTKGKYLIDFRVLEDGNIRRISRTEIEILTDDLEPVMPDGNFEMTGINVNVYGPPCSQFNATNFKPLIYVSGIDLGEKDNGKGGKNTHDLYDEFIVKGEIDELRKSGFKIYVVDWQNSQKSLLANAQHLTQLINHVNEELKDAGNPNQLVILASSIGGIISRYALTKMENEETQEATHNCRLLVTLDSPHQGANVPIGLQHLATNALAIAVPPLYFLENLLFSGGAASSLLLDKVAVRQMLTYHVAAKTIWGTYPRLQSRVDFLNALMMANSATKGYPTQCRVILLSNGSVDGRLQERSTGGEVQSEDVIFGMGMQINVRIFKRITFNIFNMGVSIKSAPSPWGNVIEVPSYVRGIKIIGCAAKIFRALFKPSTFLSTVANCINTAATGGNEVAFDMMPIDGMSGGFAKYPPLTNVGDDWSLNFDLGFLNGFVGMISINHTPCFVPTYSALDFGGPEGPTANEPANIDFTQHSIDEIVNSTGATVFYSANQNWEHNQWGADPDDPTLIKEPIKEKEIAAENMRLDNYTLTRRAYFESKYSIMAGEKIWTTALGAPIYSYPSLPNGHDQPMSKENGFIVGEVPIDLSMPEDWNYVTLKAGNQIVLKPGFAATRNSRFHAYLQSEPECPPQLVGNRTKPSNNPNETKTIKVGAINTHKFEFPVENPMDAILNLWPNPAQHYFTLKLNNIAVGSVHCITLINAMGKQIPVQVPPIVNGQTEITLRIQSNEYGLEAGLYVVQVHCNGKNYTSKILIQP